MEAVDSATWRKSSYSGGNGGGCVEAGVPEAGTVLARDTTNRDGGAIAFTAGAWQRFISSIDAPVMGLSALLGKAREASM
jgi:Domain of unknown function (DUF397)